MLRAIVGLAFVCATVLSAGGAAAAAQPTSAVVVVLRDGADAAAIAKAHAAAHGAQISFVYTAALRGYAATIPSQALSALARDPQVAFINEDRAISAVGPVAVKPSTPPGKPTPTPSPDPTPTPDPTPSPSPEPTPTPTPDPTPTPTPDPTPTPTPDPTPTPTPTPTPDPTPTPTPPPSATPDPELPTGVDRIDGEASTRYGAANSAPAIAVIDTGSGPHSELNIAGGYNCSTGASYSDGNGHGTHVAGTIAAKKNGTGVAGVLPGARIYSVRVLNNAGSGSWSSVICGIDWVASNAAALGIKVANMSLGGSGSDDGKSCAATTDSLKKAICGAVAKNVTFAIAAGNDGADLKGFVPGAYKNAGAPLVLTVTAVSDGDGRPGALSAPSCRAGEGDDAPATFSNYATLDDDKGHTVAAPGVCILSTWKGGGYNTISGTSMATPHVTGTIALCIAAGSCAGTPADIMAKIRADAAARLAASPGYGFSGGAPGRSYGDLVYAGGY